MLYSSTYLPREPRRGEARITLPATGATSLGPALDTAVASSVRDALAAAHPHHWHRIEVGDALVVDPPEWAPMVERAFYCGILRMVDLEVLRRAAWLCLGEQ